LVIIIKLGLDSSIKINSKKTKADLRNLQKKVNVLEGKEYETKKDVLEKVQGKIKEYENSKQTCLVNLGGKKERLAGLLLEQEETRNLIEKIKLYDSIQSAFSKTGIPAMVLKAQMPAINAELSKILTGVSDFKITLETDVSSNVMDVYIEDSYSRRVIELASGMEKTIASMALRVALINLSSLSKPDILIIDEGFSALDEDNLQSCMEMLAFLKNYFKMILIISHVPEIKEVADYMIEIKHQDNGDAFVEVL
jgi:DNA repair exonuclease SbcCD ATPase subunit